MDDIPIIYHDLKYTEEIIVQEHNFLHKNIEFVYEMETNSSIDYLDLTLK